MAEETERIDWIDTLKFLGILAIYVGHYSKTAGLAYPFVFAYHVPLFFFISGFFSSSATQYPFFIFLKKKFFQILIPYFFFCTLAMVILGVQGNWGVEKIFFESYSFLMGIRNHLIAISLWFIPCLFVMLILHYWVQKIFQKKLFIFLIALTIHFLAVYFLPAQPTWFWNIDSALNYYVYLAAGMLVFPLLKTNPSTQRNKIISRALTILAVIVTCIVYVKGAGWFYKHLLAITPILAKPQLIMVMVKMAITFILIFANVILAKYLARVNLLGKIGRETLILCGTETVIKSTIAWLFHAIGIELTLINPLNTIIYSFALLVLSNYSLVKFLNLYYPNLVGKYYRLQS